MNGRQRSKTVVRLEERKADTPPAPAPLPQTALPVEANPLFGVALMKTALELKRRQDGSAEDILRGVLARMRIPEHEFRAFLERNAELKKALGGR